MDSNELANLTLEAFKEDYDPESEIKMFDMRGKKVLKKKVANKNPFEDLSDHWFMGRMTFRKLLII
ncbi:hypothetical protein [Methanolobus sp. ZRKC5]|uniref:hypothetical protein n=1 Tax=unclassified Methanolobus TaxID=2629569 RepID=UPI00313E0945